MKQQLILLRGLPGAGKSTLAKTLQAMSCALVAHFEADQFFVDSEGNYKFNGLKIEEAHTTCMTNCENALKEGHNVIVSNTFTRISEMAPYFDMAKQFEATLTVLHVERDPNGQRKSVHGIPDNVMQNMINRWETI